MLILSVTNVGREKEPMHVLNIRDLIEQLFSMFLGSEVIAWANLNAKIAISAGIKGIDLRIALSI
jgi:hypothetical protein